MNAASALLPLLDLPGVAAAASDARADLDALLWDRQVTRRVAQLAPEVAARSIRATAALEGADVSLAAVRSGAAIDGSPMGSVVGAARAMYSELNALTAVHRTAPLQAWARLAAIAGAQFLPADEVGRPRTHDTPDDPLRLGPLPPAATVPVRLEQLGRIALESTAPAVIVSAVVHAELLVLRPFGFGNGLVARAAARLVLASRGVDENFLSVPESGVLSAGRPLYVSSVRDFGTGDPVGVARWIVFWCAALHEGGRETIAVSQELTDAE